MIFDYEVDFWNKGFQLIREAIDRDIMKKLKKEEITTSSNIGVTPENPPTGSFKIRHTDESKRLSGGLKKIVVKTPYK